MDLSKLRSKVLKFCVFFLLFIISVMVILGILASYDDTFRFDFIKGFTKRLSSSESILESKKRNVYRQKLGILNKEYKINDRTKIKINEAWIEKRWYTGVWYWTTNIDTRDNHEIVLKYTDLSKFPTKMIFKTKADPLGDYNFMSCCDSICLGSLENFDFNQDYLVFYYFKEDILGFDKYKILGELKLELK